MRQLWVLVPKPFSRPASVIEPKSGIVGERVHDDRLRVYYEGNLHNAVNLHTLEDKLKCAAGRLIKNYPTVAFGVWSKDEFEFVGTFDVDESWQTRLEVVDQPTLDRWLAGLVEVVR